MAEVREFGDKHTNIIGVPFKQYVSEQLTTRALNISQTGERTQDNILYLANKNCWIKLTSFVTVQGGYAGNLSESTPEGTFLAENWVLFGGTSYLNKNTNPPTNNLRYGIEENPTVLNDPYLSITNNSAYGLGGVSQQGYKVMPGIKSAKIQHMGTAGSLRSATVNFYVGNKQQLDIIDMLYFRLGYSCLLEWGHTSYLDNKGKLQSNIFPIDIFDTTTIKSKEDVLFKINEKKQETNGNYDAMYGIIGNYEWNLNVDGGYDCNVKLMGLGSIIDSLKINQTFSMTDGKYTGATQNKTNGNTQQVAPAPTGNPVSSPPQIIDDKLIAYPNGQSWALDGSEAVGINYEKLIGIQSESSFNFSYITTNKNYLTIGSTDGAKILNKNTPKNKKLLIKKDGNKYSAYNPESKRNESINSLTNIDFINTKSTDPNYKLSQFKLELLPEQKNIRRTVRLSKDIPLQEKTKNFYELKSFEEIKEKGFLNTLKDAFLAGAGQQLNDIKDLFTTGDLSFFDLSDEIIAAGSSIFAKQVTSKSIRITYDIPYDTFKKNIDIIYSPFGRVGQTLKSQDPQDADKVSLPALQLFYSNFLSGVLDDKNKIENPTTSYKIKGADGKDDTLQITINDYIPTSKNTTLDLSVSLTLTDNGVLPAQKVQTIKKYVEDIYSSVESTSISNKDQYAISSTTSTNDFATANYGGKNIKKNFNIARITFTFDTKKFSVTTTPEETVPGEDIAAPAATLPTTIMSNIDKFLIEVRDEAAAKGTGGGKIDLYDFINTKMSTGVLNKIRLKTENEPIPLLRSEIPTDPEKRLGYFIKKGFNSEVISGEKFNVGQVPNVNFRELFTAYYAGIIDNQDQGLTSKYIYIKLGLLLYFINNSSVLYEQNGISEKEFSQLNRLQQDLLRQSGNNNTLKRPFIYIDFNPETNFCLTTKFHFSVDPSICLIPVNISPEGYKSLFPNIVIPDAEVFKTSLDNVSRFINTGFSDQGGLDQSRAKIMNIGVNIDHVINILQSQAKSNPETNVYLRPFIETLVSDINKSLGNINKFRVGYYDDGNTVRIYDDQYVNPSSGQTTISTNTPTVDAIPIFGKNSIARNITLKTGVSTAMSNQIAISSQAGNLGELNVDASSLGNINSRLLDRLMRVKEVAANPVTSGSVSPADESSASIFNDHLVAVYNRQENNKTNAEIAKNYYCTVANKLKANLPSTSIKPVLPLELNITTDGISGMSLLEGFIIPTDILPMQYLTQGKSKVGFAIMGLDHSIEGNQWTTNIKGQMINLPDPTRVLSSELGTAEVGAGGAPPKGNFVGSQSQDSKFLEASSTIPVVKYLQSKGYTNGNIPDSELRNLKIPDDPTSNQYHKLFPAAATQWEKLVAKARKDGYTVRKFNISYLKSAAYRPLASQVAGEGKATPGSSPHGWGIAVDVQQLITETKLAQGLPATSKLIPTSLIANAKVRQTSALYKWLAANASEFGYTNPPLLRDGAGKMDETWHWEYWGPVNV